MMAKEYTVRKMAEQLRMSDEGKLENVVKVDAVTAKGTPFTLILSEEQATPEKAAKILEAKAKRLDDIKGL